MLEGRVTSLNFLLGVHTGEQRQPLLCTLFVERLSPSIQSAHFSLPVNCWIPCIGKYFRSSLQSLDWRFTFLFSFFALIATTFRFATSIDSLAIGWWLHGILIVLIVFFEVGTTFFSRDGSLLSNSLVLIQRREKYHVRNIPKKEKYQNMKVNDLPCR